MGLFDFLKYDKDERGADVDEETALELRRIANLFLLSSVILALFVLRAFGLALDVTFIPDPVSVVWGIVLLLGWAVTLVYGVYVTFLAQRWGWLVLCLIPVTSVPAAVAYAWIRRQEIERAVLGDGHDGPARRKDGDKGRR